MFRSAVNCSAAASIVPQRCQMFRSGVNCSTALSIVPQRRQLFHSAVNCSAVPLNVPYKVQICLPSLFAVIFCILVLLIGYNVSCIVHLRPEGRICTIQIIVRWFILRFHSSDTNEFRICRLTWQVSSLLKFLKNPLLLVHQL